MNKFQPDHDVYPFNLPSYQPALDDGVWCQRELTEEADPKSWRSERYATDSHVLILDHDHGHGTYQYCNDVQVQGLLDAKQQPQIRFVLLQPTPHERLRHTTKLDERPDHLDISKNALLRILTKYSIAPAACSHIRGQEQFFGSRVVRDASDNVEAFEFWFAIRARAYVQAYDTDADLKMTIVVRYHVPSASTFVLLKYRSWNDLPDQFKDELVQRLIDFIQHPKAASVAGDPFSLFLFHFSSTVQYYRKAAREPRDSVRDEEEKAHSGPDQLASIDLRRLHLTLASLDQDKVQLTFILDLISRLKAHHDLFYRIVKKQSNPVQRDWLYLRIEEELERFENQLAYFKSSIEDVATRAQRLLDLLFNLSARSSSQSGEKMAKQAMHESASMGTIAIVTMIYLPTTLVSGILGTNLIAAPQNDSASEHILWSSQWWILPVVAIPLTLFTFGVWYVWKILVDKHYERKVRDEEAISQNKVPV